MVKFQNPHLIYSDDYKVSKRDVAYPYVLGSSIALIIILTIIEVILNV